MLTVKGVLCLHNAGVAGDLSHKIFEKLKVATDDEIKDLSEILLSLASLIAGVSIDNPTEIAEKIVNLLA